MIEALGSRSWVDFLARSKHKVRTLIDKYPRIYLSICRIRPSTKDITVSKDTDLVIEGFPRSANTFSVAAFQYAQDNEVKVARHLHAPAQIIAAVRLSIPIIVLIRNPVDAVVSLKVRNRAIRPKQAFTEYIHFYSTVESYSDYFVLATFEEVTNDFGSVIKRLNEKFSADFNLFNHSQKNEERVFEIVEQMDKEDTGSEQVQKETVARPSKEREKLKQRTREKLESIKFRKAQSKAIRIYNKFTGNF